MQKNSAGDRDAALLQSRYAITRLSNGLRVVSEEIPHVRSVSVGVWINTGSRDESESINGISHFVEHMVFKGTGRYSSRAIARSLESVGGYLNAFTTKEHTCYYARVLDEHLPKAIDVLSDLVQDPLFDRRELEKERGVILEELKNIEDDPDDLIHDYLDANVYHRHPLGFPIIGKADNIRRFAAGDLFAYMSERYDPREIVVAAAGRIRHEDLVQLTEKFFRFRPKRARRNGGGKHGRHGAVPKRVNAGRRTFEKPITQAHICLGTLGYGVKSRYRYPLLVLNALLGEGMSSRLFQNIREKFGFAYSVYSFASLLSDTGSFGVYIGTDEKHIDESLRLIHRELAALRTREVGAAELKRTKAQIKGTMMLSLESMSNRMMRLGSGELYYGEYLSLDEVLRKVDAVDAASVNDVARRLFRDEEFSTVIFKPGGKAPGAPREVAA